MAETSPNTPLAADAQTRRLLLDKGQLPSRYCGEQGVIYWSGRGGLRQRRTRYPTLLLTREKDETTRYN